MNISTVANNLRATIAGKEKALALYESRKDIPRAPDNQVVMIATIEFLKINIAELKCILKDVEACCEESVYNSWAANPDRSGGSFTAEEINNQGWK